VSRQSFLFRLVCVLITGWLIAFWPARWMHGIAGVAWVSVAAGVMLLSGVTGSLLVSLTASKNPLAEPLLHSANRALWVVVASAVVKTLQPATRFSEFYGWLILFYLLLMALEVLSFRQANRQQRGSASNRP
jgi:cbb3-type cytochrome oxidase subunit 3